MPKPKDDESKEEFVKRCMSNDVMKDEYEDKDQRLAVCYDLWDKSEEKSIPVTDNSEPPEPVEVKLSNDIEKRFTDFTEYRVTEDDKPHIQGFVTVYKKLSDPIWNFNEKMRTGAFKESLDDESIIKKSYFNHDPNIVLGNTENDSVTFTDKKQGIWLDTIPPATQAANDVVVLVRDGYVNHASFAFTVTEEKWSGTLDNPIREIIKGVFHEGGPVSDAAYPQTSVNVRAMYQGLGIDFKAIRSNVARYHLGIEMTTEEMDVLKRTADKLNEALNSTTDSGESEEETVARAKRMEAIIRKLDLIERLYC